MNHWIDRRRAGVLLHISSLPGPFQQGVLGEEAHRFMDGMVEGGFSVWQILPLGPTHGHGSPYESLSTFAGNPDFIDLRQLVGQGWLSEASCQASMDDPTASEAARAEAAAAFWAQTETDEALAGQVQHFRAEQADWLADYALFAALKKAHANQPWWQWPSKLVHRYPEALHAAQQEHKLSIQQTEFEQFIFARQWQALKAYAESRGVLILGDLPIYVAHDSADVWSHQHFFTINDSGFCYEVAGVPPDYFSDTGQRWGNPLYHWENLEKENFHWWVKRVQVQLTRMHMMRIDHFRGLEAYWAIPGESQDGRIGEWRPAPGAEMLEALQTNLGRLPLVAEDLGLITPEVHALRQRFGLPGMKILQFAFGGGADNHYLPHHHEADSVVYTGTHDNDTTLGWFQSQPEHCRKHVAEYLGMPMDDMPWPLIRAALASVARLAVVPMQDLLSLGSEARLNTPGTLDDNWNWRMPQEPPAPDVWSRVQRLNQLYNR
ncbi:MAG: 4-alpha-glucanotransferase [Mariprofundaceae bacterium]